MEYKLHKGDKVRIKEGTSLIDLEVLGISNPEPLLHSVLTITDDTPGGELWNNKEYNGLPTYSIDAGLRLPEALLIPE